VCIHHGSAVCLALASHPLFIMVAQLWKSWLALSFVALSACARIPVEKRNDTTTFSANLLHESMNWMDMYYDSDRGYLFSLSAAALTHETRASVWYAAGLLARNQADDVEQAVKIVRNVVGAQFKNESQQWWVVVMKAQIEGRLTEFLQVRRLSEIS
jgi:hypothetical protein